MSQTYSDIFSMAVAIIEWFTGKRAWHLGPDKSEHPRMLHERKLTQQLPEGLQDVLQNVRPLLTQCLNYNCKERPSASDIEKQLLVLAGA